MSARAILKNRIVGHDLVPASQLLANPWNYRRHGAAQRAALTGSLRELGWLKSVQVNRTTGHVLDGHLRIDEGIKTDEPVPVEWVDLTEAEEKLALAILDPMTGMAAEDDEALGDLLDDVEAKDQDVQAMLDDMRPDGAKPLSVQEIDLSEAAGAQFWLSVRGPLPKQRDALQKLIDSLEELGEVEIDIGTAE